jgi:hypothetical protein
VGRVVAGLGEPGPVALITAGWQEDEDQDTTIRRVIGRDCVNLRLYERAERVWWDDPELASAHHALQERVRTLRRAYNLRLAHAMDAWIELENLEGDPETLSGERDSALEAVRVLDRRHASCVQELRIEFYDRFDPLMRSAVASQREQVRRALGDARVVVVEGGHVPILLNRLRLFGAGELLAGRTVVACSGGAMALASHVVLFHDAPPWGPGHAELGEVGLGLFASVVAFPHGSHRLRIGDPERVGRLARRFAPDACVLLDPGTRLDWHRGEWQSHGARRLAASGSVETWGGAA